MIDKGADVHNMGAWGETCLHCAARHCYIDAAKILVKAGCDIYATDDQVLIIHERFNSVKKNTKKLFICYG